MKNNKPDNRISQPENAHYHMEAMSLTTKLSTLHTSGGLDYDVILEFSNPPIAEIFRLHIAPVFSNPPISRVVMRDGAVIRIFRGGQNTPTRVLITEVECFKE